MTELLPQWPNVVHLVTDSLETEILEDGKILSMVTIVRVHKIDTYPTQHRHLYFC